MLCYTLYSNIVTLTGRGRNNRGGERLDKLISKKELLELYGISYGTLYRWKRMGLIPEDWLVKKSTFTGQETFFNRELICRRVEEILAKKDTSSLGEIQKELGKKTEVMPKIRIVTNSGDKLFYLSDVRDVIIYSDEKERSIMDTISKMLGELDIIGKKLGELKDREE